MRRPHRPAWFCCDACDAILAYRRRQRRQWLWSAAYCLTWAVLIVTAPFNPRAWRKR